MITKETESKVGVAIETANENRVLTAPGVLLEGVVWGLCAIAVGVNSGLLAVAEAIKESRGVVNDRD